MITSSQSWSSELIALAWQVFDLMRPFTCPTVRPFKIPLAMFLFQLLALSSAKMSIKWPVHFKYACIVYFSCLMTSCCFHAHLIVPSKNQFAYRVIMASNQASDPLLWREAAAESNHAKFILDEAQRLEQIDFRKRIEQGPNGVDNMIFISDHCANPGDSLEWARLARGAQDSAKTAQALTRAWLRGPFGYNDQIDEIIELLSTDISSLELLREIMTDNGDQRRFLEHIDDLGRTEFSDSAEFDWFDYRAKVGHFKPKTISALMRIVRRDHTNYRARVGIAAALTSLARSETDPDNVEASIQLGLILASFSRFTEAMPLLEKMW